MFYYFLEEYKNRIKIPISKKIKKLSLLNKVVLALLLLCTIGFGVALFLSWAAGKIVFFLIIILLFFAVLFIDSLTRKNFGAILKRNYSNHYVEPLKQLLQQWDLYNDKGCEWILERCKDERIKNSSSQLISSIGKITMTLAFPVFTLCIGAIIGKSDHAALVSYLEVFFFLYILFVVIYSFLYYPVVYIMFPNRKYVDILEEQIMYIRVALLSNLDDVNGTIKSK